MMVILPEAKIMRLARTVRENDKSFNESVEYCEKKTY